MATIWWKHALLLLGIAVCLATASPAASSLLEDVPHVRFSQVKSSLTSEDCKGAPCSVSFDLASDLWTKLSLQHKTALQDSDNDTMRLLNIPDAFTVTYSPRNKSFVALGLHDGSDVIGRQLLVDADVAGVEALGSPSHFLVDLMDLEHGLGPIWIESALDHDTGLDFLVVRSSSLDFSPVSIMCENLETLTILGGPNSEQFMLGKLPEAFVGALRIEGGDGDDSIDVVEEQRHYNGLHMHGADVSIHKALIDPCPVSVMDTGLFTISATCECFGFDSVAIQSDSVTVSSTGIVRSASGPLSLIATDPTGNGLLIESGGLVAATAGGSITLSGNGVTTGVDIQGTLSASGMVDIDGAADSNGVSISGNIDCSSLSGSTMTITGVANNIAGDKAGVKFGGPMFNTLNYDVTITGDLPFFSFGVAKVNGIIFDGGTYNIDSSLSGSTFLATTSITTGGFALAQSAMEMLPGTVMNLSAGNYMFVANWNDATITGQGFDMDSVVINGFGAPTVVFSTITDGVDNKIGARLDNCIIDLGEISGSNLQFQTTLTGTSALFAVAVWINSGSLTAHNIMIDGTLGTPVGDGNGVIIANAMITGTDAEILGQTADIGSAGISISDSSFNMAGTHSLTGSAVLGISGSSGIKFSGMVDVVADNVVWNGLGAENSLATDSNVGILFDATLSVNLGSKGSLIRAMGGRNLSGFSALNFGNHAFQFSASLTSSFQTLNTITFQGVVAEGNGDSHGVFLPASASFSFGGLGNCIFTIDMEAQEVLAAPNVGFLQGGTIDVTNGELEVIVDQLGSGPGGRHGVHLQLSSICSIGTSARLAFIANAGNSALAADGLHWEGTVSISGAFSTDCIGGGSGHGVNFLGDVVATASGLADLTGEGGSLSGASGVVIDSTFDISPGRVSVTGISGGFGISSNSNGVTIASPTTSTGNLVITGMTSVGITGGTDNHGIYVAADIVSDTMLLVGSVSAVGGGGNGVYCDFVDISSSGLIEIQGDTMGNAGSRNAVLIDGSTVSTSAAIRFNGVSASTGLDVVGVVIADSSLLASSALITGSTVSGEGVLIQGTTTLDSMAPTTMTIEGSGATGVSIDGDLAVLSSIILDITGTGTAMFDPITGVSLMSGGSISSTDTVFMTGVAESITFAQSLGIGLFGDIAADIISLNGTAGGDDQGRGVNLAGAIAAGTSLDVLGTISDFGSVNAVSDSTGVTIGNSIDFQSLTTITGVNNEASAGGQRNLGVVFPEFGDTTVSSGVLVDVYGESGLTGNACHGIFFDGGGIEATAAGADIRCTGVSRGDGAFSHGITFDNTPSPLFCSNAGGSVFTIEGIGTSSGSASDNEGLYVPFPLDFQFAEVFLIGSGFLLSPGVRLDERITISGDFDVSITGNDNGILLLGVAEVVSPGTGDINFIGSSATLPDIQIDSFLTLSNKAGGTVNFVGDTVFTEDMIYAATAVVNVNFQDDFEANGSALSFFNDGVVSFAGQIALLTFSLVTFDQNVDEMAIVFPLGGAIAIDSSSMLVNNRLTNLVVPNVNVALSNSGSLFLDAVDGPSILSVTGDGTLSLAGDIGQSQPLDSLLVGSTVNLELLDGCESIECSSMQQYSTTVRLLHTTPGTVVTFESPDVQFLSNIAEIAPSPVTVEIVMQSLFTGVLSSSYSHLGGTRILSNGQSPSPVATVTGVFSSEVLVFDDVMLLTSADFTDLVMADDSMVSAGDLGETECFTANSLTLQDNSVLTVDFDGPPAFCDGSDLTLVASNVVLANNAALQLASSASPSPGERYFIVRDQSSLTGTFLGLPEGAVVSTGGVTFTISYEVGIGGGESPDISLLANNQPFAVDDEYTVIGTSFILGAPGILLNDGDADGQTLTVTLIAAPVGSGDLILNPNGSFTYDSQGFLGVAIFTYIATDGIEDSNPATITLTVILPSVSSTPTPSLTPSITPSVSPSITPSNTPTMTSSVTNTPSPTGTMTPSSSESGTPSVTPTKTSTMTPTGTSTPSGTASITPSETPTSTGSTTTTASISSTPSSSVSGSPSTSATETSSNSPSSTQTPSETISRTSSTTASASSTPSQTVTATTTMSASETPSTTPSLSTTASSTMSPTGTALETRTAPPTFTSSISGRKTATVTVTSSVSMTTDPGLSASHTSTPSVSDTFTATASRSRSLSKTPSPLETPSATMTPTSTFTASASSSSTATPAKTLTPSVTATVTPSFSTSLSKTTSASKTNSPSSSVTQTSTTSATESVTPTSTPPQTVSPTSSTSIMMSLSVTLTPPRTQTSDATLSHTTTPTPSATVSSTVTGTSSATSSVSSSATAATLGTFMITPSPSSTLTATMAIAAPAPQPSRQASLSATRTVSLSRTILPVVIVNGGDLPNSFVPAGAGGEDTGDEADSETPLTVSILGDGSANEPVTIRNIAGQAIARVDVPDDVNGNLVIASPTEALPLVPEISSPILNVTIVGADGNLITSFDEPIELCFSTDGSLDEDDVCLGFFNDDGEWECEDFCLQADNDGVELCGETDHLTNFALLLDSAAGSDDKCGSGESRDFLYIYLSAGAVGVAVILVVIGLILVEARVRWHQHQLEESLRSAGRATQQAASLTQ